MCKVLFFFILFSAHLFSVDKVFYPNEEFSVEAPWLTGPLLAPSSVTISQGSWNIQGYVLATASSGDYNPDWSLVKSPVFWSNSYELLIQTGLLPGFGVQIVPGASWNYTQHRGTWTVSDLPFIVNIQLYDDGFNPNHWMPSVKLVLEEVFPLGKYDGLDPLALGTDAGGTGSWVTGFGIVFGKLIHLKNVHFLNILLNLQYNIPSAVQLRGMSIYGGGAGARAKYFPGQNFFFDLAFELTLAQRWALAVDFVGAYFAKPHFSGSAGFNPDGSPAYFSQNSAIQYSIAPALEYNWSANFGLIAGVWLTVAGRNSEQFCGGVFSLNYYL